jgi:hypothetical protein
MRKSSSHKRGIALVELLVAAGAGATVLLGVAYLTTSGSLLFAKNVSTNLSHNSLRGSLDKLVQSVDQALGTITPINTAGVAVTAGTKAPGVIFDQYRGGPYVVTHPGGAGLTSSATSVTLTRSVDALAAPPVPIAGDVILLNGAETTRLKVQSVAVGGISGAQRQTLTVTLQNAAGTAISWDPNTVKTAKLVRRVAFVVVTNGPRNELRYFNNAETITNFGTSSNYSLVTNNVSTTTGDATPFSMTSVSGRAFLSVDLRIRAGQYANRLSTKEANSFSTVERVSLTLTSKGA